MFVRHKIYRVCDTAITSCIAELNIVRSNIASLARCGLVFLCVYVCVVNVRKFFVVCVCGIWDVACVLGVCV